MKKFRDMADSEKLEIIKNKQLGFVELYTDAGWIGACSDSLSFEQIYRIKTRPMSIDWSVLKDEFICAAKDSDDQGFAMTATPKKDEGAWFCPDGDYARLEALKSFDPGTVGWTESLIWRPGYANNN